MKTIQYLGFFVVSALLLALGACDKIKESDRLVDIGIIEIKSERCVLLEDYTGVGCVNCPAAAEKVKDMQELYGDHLVVVEMHAQGPSVTRPLVASDPDLRTEEAATYLSYYQIQGLPSGLVNRQGGVKIDDTWSGSVKELLDDTVSDYVNLAASAKLSGSSMEVDINGDFKKDYPENGAIGIIAMVVENNIVTEQLGNGTHYKEYVHNHVLRTVISDDVWGDKVLDAKPTAKMKISKQYTAKLNEQWKKQDLALVIAVVNLETKVVLQAAYAHVK